MLGRGVVLGALVLSVSFGLPPSAPQSAPSPPNVIVIVLDDATTADVMGMPHVRDLLVAQGTVFRRNYAPFPQCCPARATILTGQYPHNHHVLDNVGPYGGFTAFDDRNTVATYLDPVYDTQIVGKYLNDFESAPSPTYQSPGWDDWRVPVNGTTYDYVNEDVAVNGVVETHSTYMPRLYGVWADHFIAGVPAGEPWFSYLAFVSPHAGKPAEYVGDPPAPYVPPRLQGTYKRKALPDDPSINEADVSDKHAAMAALPLLTRHAIRRIKVKSRQRRESLKVVDHWVRVIVDTVAARGELDNTYFVLTSDNGIFQGQHRLSHGKQLPYEPAAQVPLIIRGPGFPAGATYDGLTGLQDLTPTILDVTGQQLAPGAPQPDGVSLLQLVNGGITTDRPELLEVATTVKVVDGTTTRQAARQRPTRYQQLLTTGPTWRIRGLVTQDGWKYLEFATGESELYDLNADPYELDNLANLEPYAAQVAQLHALLLAYEDCAGASCR